MTDIERLIERLNSSHYTDHVDAAIAMLRALSAERDQAKAEEVAEAKQADKWHGKYKAAEARVAELEEIAGALCAHFETACEEARMVWVTKLREALEASP